MPPTFRTDSLHFACFLLCDKYKLVGIHLVDPEKGLVEFEFERRPGIDLRDLYQSWSLDSYTVPAREVFIYYTRLREAIQIAKSGEG